MIIISKLFLKWCFILFIAAFLGCTAGRKISEPTGQAPEHTSNPTSDSIHFYTMGEAAYSQGDILTAYGLFTQADLHDPLNVTIKERILETLWILAQSDTSRIEELIKLAESYRARNLYNAHILRYLGLSYFQAGKNEEGLRMMREVLELDPTSYSYYDYFIYLLRYGNRTDFTYLERALKLSRNVPEVLYAIAQIYEYHDPLKSKEILEEATQTISDEESYERLIDFYRRYRDWYGLVNFIEVLLEKGKYVQLEHKVLMLEALFFLEEYDRIANNYHYFQNITDPQLIEIFFFAAYYSERYELGIEIGRKLLQNPDYPEDKKELMLSSISELYLLLQDYDQAADFLLQVDDLGMVTSVILSSFDYQNEQINIEALINTLIEKGYDRVTSTYLLAHSYIANDRKEEGFAILAEILENDPEDRDLLISIGVLYLEQELYDAAVETLQRVDDPEFESYTFIGSYYYVTGLDSLAIDYFSQAIEKSELPSSEAFLTLASLFERKKEHDKELLLMEKAVLLHPEDPMILNWLGYSLVVHTDRYREAEGYLLKAITLEPDSHYIQDSVAWLYYKMQDYKKALSYMQDIITNGVEDSTIAYHIGMIYYQLAEKDDARNYFQQAIELATNEDYIQKAEEILKEIEADYER